MIHAAVIGASGYIGGEVVRALLSHPQVKLQAVIGNESAGRKLAEEQPYLLGVTDLVIQKLDQVDFKSIDVVFLGLGSGESMKIVGQIPKGPKIIDCSADFRLQEKATFEATYKMPHAQWDRVSQFVYGLPELFRSKIKEASSVAAPGCFATACILAIAPLAKLAEGPFYISAITGSSGSGAKPKDKTHHPFRTDSVFAYESFHHRHVPEIQQAVQARTGIKPGLIFQPHSGPFVRGIFATVFAKLKSKSTAEEVSKVYRQAYEGERFVRIIEGSPNVKWVQGSNFCDIGIACNGDHAIVMSVVDNLVKGGGGQAVQCMNVMFGLPEDEGLKFWGQNP
jgi:N-acetyl-gamma-glutamyl-phosphate reductase